MSKTQQASTQTVLVPVLVPIYRPSVVNTAIGKVLAEEIKAGKPPEEIGKKVADQIKATVNSSKPIAG